MQMNYSIIRFIYDVERSENALNETQIQSFLAIHRCGSFTVAASELFLTQPAITRRVQSLEAELGIELFYRENGSVRLTHAGEVFLEEARAIDAAFQHAHRTLDGLARNAEEIAIGFPDIILLGRSDSYMAVMGLERELDGTRLKAVLLDAPPLHKNQLLRGEVDLMFCDLDLPELEHAEILRHPLFQADIFACMRAGHPLSDAGELTLDDLRGQSIRWYQDTTGFPAYMHALLAEAGLDAGEMETQSYMQLLPAIRASDEIMFTNMPLIDDAGVVNVPLRMHKLHSIGIVWLRKNNKPQLRELIKKIENLSADIWKYS